MSGPDGRGGGVVDGGGDPGARAAADVRDGLVGVVVVSHSRPLAEAAVALASEMLHGAPVQLVPAAGLDDGHLGTDATAIADAVRAADRGGGVVVLMDLGSAVLSAEVALDLLDPDLAARTVLAPAPLVEGLVVAAVTAAGGGSRDEVAAEAVDALAAKREHLPGFDRAAATVDPSETVRTSGEAGSAASPASPADPRPGGDATPAAGDAADALVGSFVVRDAHGLHARPAARVAQELRPLDATVTMRNLTTGDGPVLASSLTGVATLAAEHGHEVEVTATGPQARVALDRVLELVAPGAPSEATLAAAPPAAAPSPAAPSPAAPSPAAPPAALRGLPASPGSAVGRVRLLAAAAPAVPEERADDPVAEEHRLRRALAAVRAHLEDVRARTAREVGAEEAAIFDAHLLLLDDPALLDGVRAGVAGGLGAATAWGAAVGRAAAALDALADPYLRARAADVRAVGDEVLRELLGEPSPPTSNGSPARATTAGAGRDGSTTAPDHEPPGGSIEEAAAPDVLVAADLPPAAAAALDPAHVAAVVLAAGSAEAHSAILARARGVPAVVGAGPAVLDLPPGTVLAVDGSTGELVLDPDAATRERFGRAAAADAAARATALAAAHAPAVTRDGVAVPVRANVGSVADAEAARANGADGAGLVRTEFLFLGRDAPPSVGEQEAVYAAIAAAADGQPVTLRTLDVGGDKPLAYVPAPREHNPFLGLRGLRLSLASARDLLADQLLAVVRVAQRAPVRLMFPMVTTVAELQDARQLLDAAVARAGGRAPRLPVGIMVEVPAAALRTGAFLPYVDFCSIGTNDLAQYALAAERGNAAVAGVGDAYDPGVLQLVASVTRAAGPTPVSVCGELAADAAAVPLLLGLGVGELSATPLAVPAVKQAVRAVDTGAARTLAGRALAAPSAAAVRDLVAAHGG